MIDYLWAQKLFWNILMCGSEYFNGILVNKKDRIKIHGHDRSPKKGHVKFLNFFSKSTHIFSKVPKLFLVMSNIIATTFLLIKILLLLTVHSKQLLPNTVFIQNTVLLSNKTPLCNHAKNTALINKSPTERNTYCWSI